MRNAEKMFTFVKATAIAKGYDETLKALYYARDKHKDQVRKTGEPYFIHPLTMVCAAISLGYTTDVLLAALLLHDVVEDCKVTVEELPVSREIQDVVKLVTFVNTGNKTDSKKAYYAEICKNREAILVKLFDRCHNVSTMAGVFTVAKLKEYIEETRVYVLPLLKVAKNEYPLLSNVLFALRYQLEPLVDSIEATMKTMANEKA